MPETTTCPSLEEWGRFVREEYPPVVTAALKGHLGRCPTCSAEVRRLRTAGIADAPTQGGDAAAVAVGGAEETVQLRDAATGAVLRALKAAVGELHALAWSRDGKTLACGGENHTVRLLAADSVGPPVVLKRHKGAIAALDFSADGRLLASAARDNAVHIWDRATAKHLRAFVWNYSAGPGQAAVAEHARVSSQGPWLAARLAKMEANR